ncbi:Retrotransposon-derived protein PEG10, partial [Smittium mucronatum]
LQVLREENARLQALQAATQDQPVPATVPAQVITQFFAHVPAARMALPERYDGDRTQFRGFTNQCGLLFFTHPEQYPPQTNNLGLIMYFLTGNALRWASPYIEKGSPVFDDPQQTQTANNAIRALRQGSTTVSMYAFEFRRLMMDLDWNESALVSQLSEDLNENILDTLASFQTPSDLEGHINAAIEVDTSLTRSKEEKSRRRSGPERNQTLNLQDAFTVSMESKHMSKSAPKQSTKPVYNHPNRFMFPVTIHTPGNHSFKIMAMIDSGASGMFINKKIVEAKRISTQVKKDPISVEFIDVLPWLEIHNPAINWKTRILLFEKDYCISKCVQSQKKDSKLRSTNHLNKQNKYAPGPIVVPPPGKQSYQLMGLPIVNISQETQNHSQEHRSQEHHSQENHSQEHHSQEIQTHSK